MIKVRAKLKKTGVEYNVDILKIPSEGLNRISITTYDMDNKLVVIRYGEPIYYEMLFTPVYAQIKLFSQFLEHWTITSFDLEHFNSLKDKGKICGIGRQN